MSGERLLTDEEIRRVSRWIDEKWKIGRCPFCLDTQWEVQRCVSVTMPAHEAGGTVFGGTVLPSVIVICLTCGNTVFLNAFMLGIFERGNNA